MKKIYTYYSYCYNLAENGIGQLVVVSKDLTKSCKHSNTTVFEFSSAVPLYTMIYIKIG